MSIENIKLLNEVVDLCIAIKEEIIIEYKKRNGFSDDEPYGEGLITDCAGLVSLLLLKNALQDKIKFTDEDVQIINTSFQKVIQYIENDGFDATPFQTSEKTKDYFKPAKGFYYFDSVSWVLSLMVQIWNANKIESGRLLSTENREVVKVKIKELLNIICSGAVRNGGWGFTNNCDEADIYYSYTISESLADFADYILGESLEDEGIGNKDDELIQFLGKSIIDKVNDSRAKTSKWLLDTFILNPKFKLGEVLINPNDTTGQKFKELESDEIFTLLYYTYFVIDILIINNADRFFPEFKEKTIRSIEHGLYQSRIYFDKARETRNEKDGGWWESKASELNIDFSNNSKFLRSKNLSGDKIKEPGLVPLSLRCNILYSYYISQGQDRKIDELFKVLLEEKRGKENKPELWDTIGYNLLITERAIEGIIDYFDYLTKQSADHVSLEDESQLRGPDLKIRFDEAFRSYVENVIKEFISSDEYSRLAIPNKQQIDQSEVLTKSRIVDLLSELFTDLEFYILPDRRKDLDDRDIELTREFSKKFLAWLKNLFYLELCQADIAADKDLTIYNNLKNQRNVFKAIAGPLKTNNDPDRFYEIIQHMVESHLLK